METTNQKKLSNLLDVLVPSYILECFEFTGEIQQSECDIFITLTEKSTMVPKQLEGKEAVLDGYLNKEDILSHVFILKRVYYRIIRRRWKLKGTTESYQNKYDFTVSGIKLTKEYGSFLKESHRYTTH